MATEHGLQTANINHKCDICIKSFTQASHLRTHIRAIHKNDRSSKCDQCNETFASNNLLLSHKSTKHGAPKAFVCEECKKEFAAKSGLKHHMDKIHKNISYDCDTCNGNFTTKES